MCCDVCCESARWLIVFPSCCLSNGYVISICLCFVCCCFSFLHSTLQRCDSVSFTYCVFDVCPAGAGLLCFCSWYQGIVSRFAQYSSCCFSVAVMLSELYLSLTSQVLSLHYLLGYLSTVCPPCYRLPQSRWWPFSVTTSLNASRGCKVVHFKL